MRISHLCWRSWRRLALLAALASTLSLLRAAEPRDPAKLSAEFCVGCHGPNLVGGPAPNLLDDVWKTGSDDDSILRAIRDGNPQANMPPFAATLSEAEQRGMVAYLRRMGRQYALGLIPIVATPPASVTVTTQKHTFRLETVAAPLDTPWGIVFLPDGRMLVSDRVGQIRVIEKGEVKPEPIRGTPKPFVRQDGGYLDLIAHPEYARNGWLYLAYTETGGTRGGTMTVVVRGRIRDGAWVDQQDIFRAAPEFYPVNDFSHYGCRFLFDREQRLFFTIGDRGRALDAQDLRSPLGKIHRVMDDGRIPPDNPFAGRADALPSVWSYGHRHVQGLQYHPATGKLWATEHGPRGGDELNRIEPGRNYGWPTISRGLPQQREVIEGTERAGMESPLAWWTPSIAPAAIEFYAGDRFPRWKNSLLVASLVGRHLRRIETDGDTVTSQEVLFAEMGRVRDVVTGPDGLIYLALNNPGRIARLVPEP
ncbi:PQQ-dependent sugar dehydrogenase [Horticoccus sp. 23ND18S-11]|uniref:PQQ-dependent sugar dehydrogenase n=1 Tax=Horticoccus sp. 23ND18S-11 TaxID=3391832 RepID=UPI0039C910B3